MFVPRARRPAPLPGTLAEARLYHFIFCPQNVGGNSTARTSNRPPVVERTREGIVVITVNYDS